MLGSAARSRPLPTTGSVLVDARGGDRALRVRWHPEADLVVLSLWRENSAPAPSGWPPPTCPT